MNCFRCNKVICNERIHAKTKEKTIDYRANAINADYIMAEDTIVVEPRELLLSPARLFGILKAKTQIIDEPIQKTGIICPECYKETDFVIWGVHKGEGMKKIPV